MAYNLPGLGGLNFGKIEDDLVDKKGVISVFRTDR